MSQIAAFLQLAIQQNGSDLHLVSGQPPRIRIGGSLHRVKFRSLSIEDLQTLLAEIMEDDHRRIFDTCHAVDFSYFAPGIGRFRVNVYRHLEGLAAAMRVIPDRIPSVEDLGLPPAVRLAITQPKGLTLVTGPTGSGKTTTLAAIIDAINDERHGHVITIEDPVEFLHKPRHCAITQRQVGIHSPSFAAALRDALREDPDVVMVGEMRDTETIALALTAAETGVQVLGTLHTNGAARSVDRILNAFPASQQGQVRVMLAESLRMTISQQLVRTAEGTARKAAVEILVNSTACASVIRSGQSHKLTSVIQSGGRAGMQSLDGVLRGMVQEGVITAEEAYEKAVDRVQFEKLMARRAA